jgi:hypothetical protein
MPTSRYNETLDLIIGDGGQFYKEIVVEKLTAWSSKLARFEIVVSTETH